MPRAWATAALMGSAWEKHTTTPPTWAAAQRLQRSDNPRLHFREALAIRETEGRRAVLDGLPLRQGGHVRQGSPGPVAEIAFEQAVVVLHVPSGAGRRRLRRLAGALQRRGIDGVDREVREALRDPFSLGAAAVGQMQPRCPPRQHPARRRRLPMAHQKEERSRRPAAVPMVVPATPAAWLQSSGSKRSGRGPRPSLRGMGKSRSGRGCHGPARGLP